MRLQWLIRVSKICLLCTLYLFYLLWSSVTTQLATWVFLLYRDLIAGIYVVLLNGYHLPNSIFARAYFKDIVSTCHPVSLNVAMYDIFVGIYCTEFKKYLVMINECTTYNKSGYVSYVSFEYTTVYIS